MDNILSIIGIAVAALSLAATAVIGIRQIKMQTAANEASDKVQQLEEKRRIDELTPIFLITHELKSAGDIRLKVALTGPVGLSSLDSVTLQIRDDFPDRATRLAGTIEPEKIRKYIWGPYRLRPGVEDADEHGRTAPGKPVKRGEALYYILEPSIQPYWVEDPTYWKQQYVGTPVRLMLTSTRDEATWDSPTELYIEPQRKSFIPLA